MNVQLESDGLAILTLDEGKANAVSPALIAALARALDEVEARGARGLVITGAGKHFSAGLDLATVSALAPADFDRFLAEFEKTFERVFFLPMPVVAAVNGNAVAGGCILAAAADRRIAADADYRVGGNEVRIGVTFPSIVIDILRALLTPAKLHEVVLGAELHAPRAALELGLLDEIVPADAVMARSCEVARRLMLSPLPGYAAQKRELRSRFVEGFRETYPTSRARFRELWQGEPATAARNAVLSRIKK
jgi:enoyl-CoA hydratase